MNFKKLLQFQQAVGKISKDSTNPFFKSKYFDINTLLEEVKPLLNELGLVLVQSLSHIDGHSAIKTELYDADSEDVMPLISSTTPLPENTDPQKMGSAITYFRRYAIQSMLCLQADDDDGNSASNKVVKTNTVAYTMAKPDNYQESVYSITVKSCKTLKDLQETWLTIPEEAKTKELVALKDNLKTKLK